MNNSDMVDLHVGDIVQSGSGEGYVVSRWTGKGVEVKRTLALTNPIEWTLIRKTINYRNRKVKITNMRNGTYVYETNRDESGYVTDVDFSTAVASIKKAIDLIP